MLNPQNVHYRIIEHTKIIIDKILQNVKYCSLKELEYGLLVLNTHCLHVGANDPYPFVKRERINDH